MPKQYSVDCTTSTHWRAREGIGGSRTPDNEFADDNGTIYRLLTNPAYGGAHAYGKSAHGTRYEAGVERTNVRRKPHEQWLAFIPGTHEGYVEWERFERVQRAIRGNLYVACRSLTAAREGQALVAGLLRCRRCASKLIVHYTGQRHNVARYVCHRAWLDKGQPRCISFGGSRVDAAIAAAVLSVVQPAANRGSNRGVSRADKPTR